MVFKMRYDQEGMKGLINSIAQLKSHSSEIVSILIDEIIAEQYPQFKDEIDKALLLL